MKIHLAEGAATKNAKAKPIGEECYVECLVPTIVQPPPPPAET